MALTQSRLPVRQRVARYRSTSADFRRAVFRVVWQDGRDEETGVTVAAITAYLGAFDYTSGSGKPSRQHTWPVTVSPIWHQAVL